MITDSRHAVGNRNACQPGAVRECPIADARHAVGNRNVCQPGATIECTTADARHAVRNRDACQPGAAVERTIADARHAIANHNTVDFVDKTVPRHIAMKAVVFHLARAGNGQKTISIQRPCQIFAAASGICHFRRRGNGKRLHEDRADHHRAEQQGKQSFFHNFLLRFLNFRAGRAGFPFRTAR